jgi:hypothetical protein
MKLVAPAAGIQDWLRQLQAKGYTYVAEVPETEQPEESAFAVRRGAAEGQLLDPRRANVFLKQEDEA